MYCAGLINVTFALVNASSSPVSAKGRGAIVAINEALKDASLSPQQIQYINAHGTGTKENDSTETLAVKATFGPHAKNTPMSSIKSMM